MLNEHDRRLARQISSARRTAERQQLRGDFAAAHSQLTHALLLAKQLRDPLAEAAVLNDLGIVCKYLGWFPRARHAYRRAVLILSRDPGENDSALAALYHNLGGLEHERRRFAQGERWARQGIALREASVGLHDPALADDLAALAALLDGQSKFDEAKPLYRRALAILRRHRDHYGVAVALNNLAASKHRQGDISAATRLYRQALTAKEHLLGPRHPDVAVTCNNLALLYLERSDTAQADVLARRALKIFNRTLGGRHPRTVACRKNLDVIEAAI